MESKANFVQLGDADRSAQISFVSGMRFTRSRPLSNSLVQSVEVPYEKLQLCADRCNLIQFALHIGLRNGRLRRPGFGNDARAGELIRKTAIARPARRKATG